MKTVSIFKNRNNQAIRIPKEMEFDGVNQLEVIKEGDTLILKPVRPDWLSFCDSEKSDSDFLIDREDVIDEGRFKL